MCFPPCLPRAAKQHSGVPDLLSANGWELRVSDCFLKGRQTVAALKLTVWSGLRERRGWLIIVSNLSRLAGNLQF